MIQFISLYNRPSVYIDTEQPFNTVGQVYELFVNNVDSFKMICEDIKEILYTNAEMLA